MVADNGQLVLIVDDDKLQRNLVFQILRSAGYSVESVEDGVDAIEALKWKRYSAIILDLAMDVFGGERVISYLEQNNPALLSRVIVVTGMPDAKRKLADKAVFEVREKPVRREELIELVTRCARQEE